MPRPADTIAALATPVGTSALAVVRASGVDTAALAAELVGSVPAPRVARHLDYRARDGRLLDDVLLTFFKGPASYTGEDALEISCHGNPFIAQQILEDLFARGCRAAEPGEFTQRAFLAGKMDLSQAEAVMDVIHARGERALAAAQQQLRGGLSRRMAPLVDGVLRVLAQIEAYIDFPEEDLPAEDQEVVKARIADILRDINELSATARYGELLRDGVKTVIVGRPNVGKSSLLNRLVGRERALVSAEPGTTRDFIEERILVGPHCLRLIDTAGFNSAPGTVERLGIEKTRDRVAEADLFLIVVDGTATDDAPLPFDLLPHIPPQRAIVILNKSDVAKAALPCDWLAGALRVETSALTGAGIEELRNAIAAKADAFCQDPADLVAINGRHAHALDQARTLLESAMAKLAGREPIELVSSDIRGVLAAFGEITGRIDNERMLDELFSSFCIGK